MTRPAFFRNRGLLSGSPLLEFPLLGLPAAAHPVAQLAVLLHFHAGVAVAAQDDGVVLLRVRGAWVWRPATACRRACCRHIVRDVLPAPARGAGLKDDRHIILACIINGWCDAFVGCLIMRGRKFGGFARYALQRTAARHGGGAPLTSKLMQQPLSIPSGECTQAHSKGATTSTPLLFTRSIQAATAVFLRTESVSRTGAAVRSSANEVSLSCCSMSAHERSSWFWKDCWLLLASDHRHRDAERAGECSDASRVAGQARQTRKPSCQTSMRSRPQSACVKSKRRCRQQVDHRKIIQHRQKFPLI